MVNESGDELIVENEIPTNLSSENTKNELDFDEYSLGLTLMQHIEGQLERADNKAQFTLTIEALLLASSTIWGNTVNQSLSFSSMSFLDSFILILSLLILIILVASLVVAMLAVMPKLASPNKVNNIFYFGSITQDNESTFTELIKKHTGEEITSMLFSEIYVLSEIAKRKYELIHRSYHLLFFAIGLWTLTQILIIAVT